MATNQDSNNPMRRQLTKESPIYIPFLVNLAFILIALSFAIFNYAEMQSISVISEISPSTLSFPAK